jgi:hypothetical protein
MDDREELLDELARCYAHAAVDAFLAQGGNTTPKTATPATSAKGAGVFSATSAQSGDHRHDKSTGGRTHTANPPRVG